MALYASVAGAAGAGRGGRGGRSVREETRTCWYCFQVGHLKADCHVRQLIQRHRACFSTLSRRHSGRRAAAQRATTTPAAPAGTTIAGAAKAHIASAAAIKLRFPPSVLAQAHAILAEPRKNISRRNRAVVIAPIPVIDWCV
ncbi:hypothetical protein N7497_005179 [Penicillium chrysogenum]|nr:hypothetical protein N7497_005179 [Penicillium chrysogenum]